MNRGAWQAIVQSVMASQTRLSTHTHTNSLTQKSQGINVKTVMIAEKVKKKITVMMLAL